MPSICRFHTQEQSILNFPCSLTSNITSHSMKNLAFHSLLRRNMIILPILTISFIHILFKRLGECTLSSRVKLSNDNVSPLFLVSDKTIWGQPAYRNEMCPNSKPSGQNKPEICVEQDIPCQVEKGCSIAEWQADKRNGMTKDEWDYRTEEDVDEMWNMHGKLIQHTDV